MKYLQLEEDRFYHLYNRGNSKELLFRIPDNYRYFLLLVQRHLLPVADIYSYSLLPNHFHFIIHIKEMGQLPEAIQEGKRGIHQAFSNCFNAYAKAFNKMFGRSGSLFQEHLKRKLIESNEYLQNLILYVNANSSIHQIHHYQSYSFSSYKAIVSKRPTSVCRKEVIELFGDVENFKLSILHRANKLNFEWE